MFNHEAFDMSQIPALHCDIVDDVTLLPMVGDITGEVKAYALGAYTQKTPLHHLQRMIDKGIANYTLPPIKPQKFSAQEVIYGGIFFMHWGHFLLENLQRLWYAKQCNLPIVWVGINGFTYSPSLFKPWQSEIFSALGIHNEHIFLQEPTQFAKVHFPEPGSGINTHLHPEHARFLGYHEEKPQSGRYVYFSRAKIRGCANEAQMEQILQKKGWRIIYPEELSVSQQLHELSSAQVCLMIGGSAQHTLLLTKNLQTRCIVIPREHGTTFNVIANATSDNYYLLHVEKKVLFTDKSDEANDLFTLDIAMLENVLDKTQNFTQNIDSVPHLLSRPQKSPLEQCTVPARYYEQPTALNNAKKLFYHAHFLYAQHKYRAAHNIMQHLKKKNLLEDFMQLSYLTMVQRYHVEIGKSITLPIIKQQQHTRILQQKILDTPQETRNYKKLTNLFLIAGKVDDAIEVQQSLAQKNPQWSKPLAKIASIYATQHHYTEAIIYAEKAVQVEPHLLQRKLELAEYLLKNQDHMACIKLMTQVLMKNPQEVEAYICLAAAHHGQGKLDKAIACIKKGLEIAPHNLKALEQLAAYKQQQGNHREAIELLAKVLQQNPRIAERYAQNARVFAHKGDLEKAIEYAQKAVDLEPRNFACKAHLASYLRKNGSYAATMELMEAALHHNPFWSEPHAQMAAIYDAQGQLQKAIDSARKAVATEPYDVVRKTELRNYRAKFFQNLFPESFSKKYNASWARIQSYIDIFYAKTYLEIGVFQGTTFLQIDVPYKIGVDPQFQFDTEVFTREGTVFYNETSDTFFENFAQRSQNLQELYHGKPFKFDVIFIDGLHTFEQTLRDFENTIPYSHEKTVWIFDDTVPSNHLSALSSQDKNEAWKKCAGLSKEAAWHGDVFKAIFAIHDAYPEFSYCTQLDNGNPQTILWRTEKPTMREKVFSHTKPIAHMCYEDFVEYAWVMRPVHDHEVLQHIFTNINPVQARTGEEYKMVIAPLMTDREKELHMQNKELQNIAASLLENHELTKQELERVKEEFLKISKLNNFLSMENATLKNKILRGN